MAQELNFDELDHAVNQYMQRKVERPTTAFGQAASTPAPSDSARPPESAPPQHSQNSVSMPPKRPVVTSHITVSSHDTPHTEDRPAMRIAPRRAIAPRPVGERPATFHDIAPPRRAPAVPIAHLQPTTTTAPARPMMPRPAAAAQSAKDTERPTPSRFSDVAPLRPSKTVARPERISSDTDHESKQPFFGAEIKEEASAKVLGEQDSMPEFKDNDNVYVEPDAVSEKPVESLEPSKSDESEEKPTQSSMATFGTSLDWSPADTSSEEPSSEPNPFVSSAQSTTLSQNAETETAAIASGDTEPAAMPAHGENNTPQDLASLDKITARPAQPNLSFTSENTEQPVVKTEQKTEWPSTAGLLDTGELHTPAMLPADERGMNHANKATVGQVFDTKPYHAPIQGSHGGTSPARTAIIVILIVVFVLVAAVAVFMYVS